MRWPSKPLPQRRSDQSVRRVAAQAACGTFGFAAWTCVVATAAPPTTRDFSASRRVLFFMPRTIARFATGVIHAKEEGATMGHGRTEIKILNRRPCAPTRLQSLSQAFA